MPNFHDVLKNGYNKTKKQNMNGYVLDKQLSNHNNQIYYNKKDNKPLHNINGTNSFSDVVTDVYLAAGKLKNTSRYKESHHKLRQAKEKYKINDATITGHSLGATIAGYIGGSNDKVITADKGATLFQKVRSNETHHRTQGDLVSLLNSGSKHTVNHENKNDSSRLLLVDALNAHNIKNLKDLNINV